MLKYKKYEFGIMTDLCRNKNSRNEKVQSMNGFAIKVDKLILWGMKATP